MSNALGGASTIFALLKDVSSLVPQAGPLAQVLGITKELIGIINQMRDNGEGCSYLAERILKFLKKLSEESVRLNEPIREGSPTALRLMELQSEIQAIKLDADNWKNISHWQGFWSRDQIKAALAKHEKNLTDCFNSFLIGTTFQLGVMADNRATGTGSIGHSVNLITSDADNLCARLAVPDAAHNRSGLRHRCLEGTRENVIAEIMDWSNGLENHPICWLSGSAGFGKSAIMQTVAERHAVSDKAVLAGSFFFLRGAGARSKFTRVISTLAYHISQSIPEAKDSIQHALQNDPTIPQQSIEDQFQKLVVSPLQQLGGTKSFVVVMDALDECDDHESICEFITVLAQTYSQGRLRLKFLLASRAEDHLCKIFAFEMVHARMHSLELGDFDAHDDITTFLKSQFMKIRLVNHRMLQGLDGNWPSNMQLTALSEKSQGLFVFAATVVSYVMDGKGSPREKLDQVLESHVGLDPLYTQVLSSIHRDQHFLEVLAALVLLSKQLSINSLAHLLDMGTDEVVARLLDIQSLIRIPANNDDIVQLNHASFQDYLLDETRSKTHYICLVRYNMVIGIHCLTLTSRLRTWPNDHAEEYAYQEWHQHLESGVVAARKNLLDEYGLATCLEVFLKSHGLEVWINRVIRDLESDRTFKLLKAVEVKFKVLQASGPILQLFHTIRHCLKEDQEDFKMYMKTIGYKCYKHEGFEFYNNEGLISTEDEMMKTEIINWRENWQQEKPMNKLTKKMKAIFMI